MSSSALSRRLLLAAALLAVVAGAFSPRDLWAPDEPRYGQVAREMLEHGDWLVPHVNREPYPEKPPLWFWIAAGISRPGSAVTAVGARLAGALLAAGAVLLTALLGRRLFRDPELGATAALLFASTGLVLWNAPRAALDLPLTFFVLAAVERLSAWWAHGRLSAAVLGGVAWAGAVLVKGPVGFFLPPLVLAGGALLARHAPRARNAGWWVAPTLLATLSLAWLLPALAAGGEAYADRLLGQLGARAAGAANEGHVRPPAYYLLRVGPLALPWTLHLLAGCGALLCPGRRPREDRFGLGASGAGSLGLLLVLSLFATKRETYVIPGLPFAALLAAYAMHRGLLPRLRAWGRGLVVATLGGFAVGLALAPWLLPRLAAIDPLPAKATVASLLAAGGLALAAVSTWRARSDAWRAMRGAAPYLLLGAVVVHVVLLPPLDARKSFGPLARQAEAAARGGEIVAVGWRRIPNLLWRLEREHVDYAEGLDEVLERLAPAALPVVLVVEHGYWEKLSEEALTETPEDAARLENARVTWDGRVGHRRMLVVSNR